MRFGLQLHASLPLAAYPRLAARAEAYGFVDLTVHDLLLRRPVWPLLVTLAGATRRIAVGPDVTHPVLHHPATIAANIAHLDEVSGGRAVLGIGRGSMYGWVGLGPLPGPSLVGEAIEAVRHLLAGRAGGFRGRHFTLAPEARLVPAAPRAAVPIFVGTFGPRLAELAGGVADGVRAAAQWDPRYLARLREHVAAGARKAGRDPAAVPVVAETWLSLAADRSAARRLASALLAPFLPHLEPMLGFYGIDPDLVARVSAALAAGDGDAAARLVPGDIVDLFMAAGDPDDVGRGLERLRASGVHEVSFSGVLGPDPEAALTLLGETVLPAFHG
jgi:5,10-methylenetetrahydromethanopterin reductase